MSYKVEEGVKAAWLTKCLSEDLSVALQHPGRGKVLWCTSVTLVPGLGELETDGSLNLTGRQPSQISN